MRYGIIADTHNRILTPIFEALAGVEEILHAGDVCRRDVMAEIEVIAPVVAVHGNCDERELVDELPAQRWIEREGISIAIVHGHQTGSASSGRIANLYTVNPNLTQATIGQTAQQLDLVIFGHSHRPSDAVIKGTRYFNPGTAGGIRYHPTIGLLTIDGGNFDLKLVNL